MLGTQQKKHGGKLWLAVAPLYIFTLLFVAGPLIYMVILSFQTRAEGVGVINEFTLDNYKKILDPVYLGTFVQSLKLAVISTVIRLFYGEMFAQVEATSDDVTYDSILDQCFDSLVWMDDSFTGKRSYLPDVSFFWN